MELIQYDKTTFYGSDVGDYSIVPGLLREIRHGVRQGEPYAYIVFLDKPGIKWKILPVLDNGKLAGLDLYQRKRGGGGFHSRGRSHQATKQQLQDMIEFITAEEQQQREAKQSPVQLNLANITIEFVALLTRNTARKGETLIWASPEAKSQAGQIIAGAVGRMVEPHRRIKYRQIICEMVDGQTVKQIGWGSQSQGSLLASTALYRLRNALRLKGMDDLAETVKVVPVPGGPYDPAWISIREAHELTDLSRDHLRLLARQEKVVSRIHPTHKGKIQLNRESLKKYIETPGGKGRRKKGQIFR